VRFAGFESSHVDVGETTIFVQYGGRGNPILLLHGFPETHVMWHRVAPLLAEEFTVVCADLRGYGASGKPASSADHAPYSKRTMAGDMVRAMERLGFERFGVAGHDRGGRVAYRMALDHVDRIDRVALLDIIPTVEAFERADSRLALAFWPWSLLAQPTPLPERLIVGDPEAVIEDAISQWDTDRESFPALLREVYVNALRDRDAVHAICEEYRAAATVDVAHDARDREDARRIECPVLVLWSAGSALDTWYVQSGGPLGIWRAWAPRAHGRAITGGHFFPEANPSETVQELRTFFA
jgi:haloacetate dehalogenase